MNFYRKHWPDVGVGLATGIGIGMTVFRKKRSHAQMWSAWNLVALTASINSRNIAFLAIFRVNLMLES